MEYTMQSKRVSKKYFWKNEKCPHQIKVVRQNLYYVKFFFLVCFVGFTLPLIWVRYAIELKRPHNNNEIKESHSLNNSLVYSYKNIVNRSEEKLPEGTKYILIWTKPYRAPVNYIKEIHKNILQNNCSVNKCFVTRNRNYFRNNLTRFDAIGFVGQDLNTSDMPDVRSWHQKYIYFNMESADNYPVCASQYDGFFNWTSTYKLDSDIPYPYIVIRDMNGNIVGPKETMHWKRSMAAVGEEFYDRIVHKTKAAAWFVSNCRASGRLLYIRKLKYALLPYGLTVDVYGKCGTLNCARENMSMCDEMLARDYFFYMAMENTVTKDYVTEKLLRALNNDVVPIVYGGANYSRFLPPGSYIDARKKNANKMAAMMSYLMNSPKQYLQYFRWKKYYTYHDPIRIENVCALCEALHNQKKNQDTTIYDEFRRWWNPDFKKQCLIIERKKRKRMNLTTKTTQS